MSKYSRLLQLIRRNKLLVVLVFVGVVILDQSVKYFVVTGLADYQVNTGISLSIFDDNGLIAGLLSLGGVVLLAWLFSDWKNQTRITLLAFTAVFAAAISNLADRFLYQGVIDYISISVLPTFNLADLIISLGIAALVIWSIIKQDEKEIRGNK